MTPGRGPKAGVRRAFIASVFFALLVAGSPGAKALADATATPVVTDTAVPTVAVSTPTATALPTPTAVATPTATPRPRPTATAIRPRHERHRTTHIHISPTKGVVRAATATATPIPETHHHRASVHKRKHGRRAKPTATPTPTATSTPAINLNAEDTISPVTCNGPTRPNAGKPFLLAPYHGWTSIVSFVDHDAPNFSHDGLITIATGASAQPDAVHVGTGFPAYWNASLRQYLYYDGHNGYDFNLWYVPVYAAAAGKVIFARLEYLDAPDHGYGNMVMINHHHGYVTLYGHLSKILVKNGQTVRAGQKIGISGNTGHSTGPHLHFSIFHNCTPTDPYGWSGPGPDPLSTYQGESSSYLWKRQPLIDNPPPGWPGIGDLPAPPFERILLLRLPSTRSGTGSFTAALKRLANRDADTLRAAGASVSVDSLRGAVLVIGAQTPSTLYSLPGIASISSPGTVEGAHQDVLAALAQAALVVRPKEVALSPASKWKGYLLTWEGHTFLIGTGARGREAIVRFNSGRGGAQQHLHADAHTGAYAVDLGPLSRAQRLALAQKLAVAGQPGKSLAVATPLPKKSFVPPEPGRVASPDRSLLFSVLGLLAVVMAMVAGRAARRWRRRVEVTPDPE